MTAHRATWSTCWTKWGQQARVRSAQVGFETLRWTSAVRDFRTGVPEDRLRQKMGLTKISWRETREKIYKLAGRTG